MDLDFAAVRAFVTITEERTFSEAAARLGISQQAISKRIAKLESDLGVRLFFRTRSGAELTEDGRTFLHHARSLVGIADQALALLRGRRRSLRIDVLDTRVVATELVRAFHDGAEDVDIEITTSNGLRSARGALARGSIDAAFARVMGTLDEELRHLPAYLEPIYVLVDRSHPLARLREVPMSRLAASTIWMPGNVAGSEWEEFYRLLGVEFDLEIDTSGPDFGWEHYVEQVSSRRRISLVGDGTRLPAHPRTVQVPIVRPTPVYPCSLLYHRQNYHPALTQLIDHVTRTFRPFDPSHQWLPEPDLLAYT
ncbi:LysR family transcriptional regulator [Tenggerimyces flavus]|uniref:LysR family transcriptional regulator n=1 Tax=Tenggerimyces flavus TaxID=1708749 RepID=A0ABV7YA31_9ACTN|nr:LysR family transcriptional regulator [Tenggerimyces flavus]MBM7783671.1 DNA-binding transcriptional LysR family regulator [Tenggerimyces flavus]